jgi:hypothetical protein
MKPYRQTEAATLMNDAGIYSAKYAKAIFASTPKNQLTDPDKPKKIKGLDDAQMARMENEMANLQKDCGLIEESYGPNFLTLTIVKDYVRQLLGNAEIVKYLAKNYSEFLTQFQKIAEMKSL